MPDEVTIIEDGWKIYWERVLKPAGVNDKAHDSLRLIFMDAANFMKDTITRIANYGRPSSTLMMEIVQREMEKHHNGRIAGGVIVPESEVIQ